MTSLGLGLLSLIVALCLAYLLTDVMLKPGWSRKWVLSWMIMLLCLPGSLLGLGMVALSQAPGLNWLSVGDISLILTHALRFAPYAALLLLGLRLLEPGWKRDELRMTGAGRLAALRFIHVPLEWPKWLAISVVLLTLMLSELASAIMVVAPGTETAILRLYNLMHYGAVERVNALALSQAGLVALIFTISGGLLMRHVRHA
jgi:ABC-type Fe3+ transport system permease subunit